MCVRAPHAMRVSAMRHAACAWRLPNRSCFRLLVCSHVLSVCVLLPPPFPCSPSPPGLLFVGEARSKAHESKSTRPTCKVQAECTEQAQQSRHSREGTAEHDARSVHAGQARTTGEGERSKPMSQPRRYIMACASRSRCPSGWCEVEGSRPAQKPSAPPFKMLNLSYQLVSESWMSSGACRTCHTCHTRTHRHHWCIAP